MIVTCQAVQDAERRLFDAGVEAEPLMEDAGWGCACAIRQFCPRPGLAVLFVGKGNNGGDALVVGRHLRRWGWHVQARLAGEPEEMTDLTARKLAEFEAEEEFSGSSDALSGPVIAVDGLLGIGARGPLRGGIGELAEETNAFREQEHALTFAIDIPSGVDGDSGEPYPGAVMADVTLTISAVKSGLVADQALDHVGRLVMIPMPEIAEEIAENEERAFLSTGAWVAERLPRRRFSWHKGTAGRVAIVAGSRGLTGAARLSSLGALHGGAGLVTVFAHESIYEIVAASAPPEVMVRPTRDYADVAEFNADVIAIGPGLGTETGYEETLLDLMRSDARPMVIDADGLNLLGRKLGRIDEFSPGGPRLLTPHPGELARLLGGNLPEGKSRIEIAREVVEKCPVALLFKGSRSVIAERDELTAINSTGHPGMATGGIGDVLTGLCAALIGQGMSLHDAAASGSWLIGRAAEIALTERKASPESLSAGQIAEALGAAFDSARSGAF
ncbi:MAG: NAD(P)H-hydrate dehydratase [Verrucomicrobiae bacterium]|nr:NAD(P)H-hydrate dehydratase [Verrucomicrobiae bacterium]